jgi:hypothetical protein
MMVLSLPGLSNEMFERLPNTFFPCLPEDIGSNQYRILTRLCVQLPFTIVNPHPFILTSVAICSVTGLHCVSCKFNGRDEVRVLAQLGQMILSAGLLLFSAENEWKGLVTGSVK